MVDVGRRLDLPPGSTALDIADDYAALIREQWGTAVGVMGFSSGGGYAQWLAIRHPELVERLVLGFTGDRVTDETRELQRRAVDHALAGRWRAGYATLGPWFVPLHPRLVGAALWLVGPFVGGRRKDLRALRIDADADDTFDASGHLDAIRCPTLIGSGGRDAAYPPDVTRELVAGIAGARHIDYPTSGYGGPGRAFAEEACAFLADLAPAAWSSAVTALRRRPSGGRRRARSGHGGDTTIGLVRDGAHTVGVALGGPRPSHAGTRCAMRIHWATPNSEREGDRHGPPRRPFRDPRL